MKESCNVWNIWVTGNIDAYLQSQGIGKLFLIVKNLQTFSDSVNMEKILAKNIIQAGGGGEPGVNVHCVPAWLDDFIALKWGQQLVWLEY